MCVLSLYRRPHHPPPTVQRRVRTHTHSSMRSATPLGSVRTSHSHTRMTRQPSCSASAVARRSRSSLRRILAAHSSALGPDHGVLRPCRGHPCQKHPSTNTAKRRPGRTKSGVHPLARRGCRRNRAPAAWTARRRRSSGVVLSLRRPARWAPALVEIQPSAMYPRYETRNGPNHAEPDRLVHPVQSCIDSGPWRANPHSSGDSTVDRPALLLGDVGGDCRTATKYCNVAPDT